jgi:hemerythrin
MSTFEWKTDFCTGIEEMDKHHKMFFNYLNELEKTAGGSKGKEVIDRGIKQVENYIKYHFAEEENLLRVTGSPDYAYQKKQHDFFALQIEELKDRFYKGDQTIPVSTLVFLKDWFLNHILETDKKYGSHPQEVKKKAVGKE